MDCNGCFRIILPTSRNRYVLHPVWSTAFFMYLVDSYVNDQYSPYTNKTKDLDPYKDPYKIHTRE